MTNPVIWVSYDQRPGCGEQLTASLSDASVTQECRSRGWAVAWAPEATGGER
jgi:hypothetical protein